MDEAKAAEALAAVESFVQDLSCSRCKALDEGLLTQTGTVAATEQQIVTLGQDTLASLRSSLDSQTERGRAAAEMNANLRQALQLLEDERSSLKLRLDEAKSATQESQIARMTELRRLQRKLGNLEDRTGVQFSRVGGSKVQGLVYNGEDSVVPFSIDRENALDACDALWATMQLPQIWRDRMA